ncbi:hypothetical protein [Bradyrhizobium liaoningense]
MAGVKRPSLRALRNGDEHLLLRQVSPPLLDDLPNAEEDLAIDDGLDAALASDPCSGGFFILPELFETVG